MKKGIFAILTLLPLVSLATPDQFVSFNYDIVSTGKTLSDAECFTIFNAPLYYNIIGDKPQYQNTNSLYQVVDYQRLSTTFLNEHQRLFYGKQKINIMQGNKTVQVTSDVNFMLDTKADMIKGSWYIPGYCQANFIGVEQKLGHWDHSKDGTKHN